MTANEYQKLAMVTLNPDLSEKEVLINGVMGLCGEAGEVIDLVKKHLAQGHELDRKNMVKELGDVAWYLAETAYALGVPLEEVLQSNIDKLKARYPQGFEAQRSIHRIENTEGEAKTLEMSAVRSTKSNVAAAAGAVACSDEATEMSVSCSNAVTEKTTLSCNELNIGAKNAVDCKKPAIYLPERPADSNKGTFGKVLFIGANNGCAGAGALACEAAFRAGCGLVKALVGKDSVSLINIRLPEVMTGVLFESDSDLYNEAVLEAGLEWATVIIIGPGLGTGDAARNVLQRVLLCEKPKIIDADAINIMSEMFNIQSADCFETGSVLKDLVKGKAVFTPHVSELSRMTGMKISDLKGMAGTELNEHPRLGDVALQLADERIIFVCKDANTAVSNGDCLYINATGNSGMSTGGSGDVLAGLMGGLVAAFGKEPKVSLLDMACSAVALHGMAGDAAAKEMGMDSMLAGDIIRHIPGVIKKLRG